MKNLRTVAGKKKVIGVWALQGCVNAHRAHIEALGAEFLAVRNLEQLARADALILPGGESSTMLKLLKVLDFENALAEFIQTKPTWGICAGSILMAKKVTQPEQRSFGVLDIDVVRNAYGRQLDSFECELSGAPVAFIRAPQISRLGPNVQSIARYDGQAVWVLEKNRMATTFHPELSPQVPSPMHTKFLELVP